MTAFGPGTLALDGGDPRRPSADVISNRERQASIARSTGHKLHDTNVSFEEYLFYAKISRSDERYEDPDHSFHIFGKTIIKGRYHGNPGDLNNNNNIGINGNAIDSKMEKGVESPPRPFFVSDEEYVHASRAVRTASWGAVFYLITTDILGPFSTPWAFAAMGYGPGVALFTVFGGMAAYGGFLLWRMFLGLDSDRYPLRTYGDIAFRVYGNIARYGVNILQSIQLLFNVGIIIVANGLSLVEIVTGANPNAYSCFVILCVVWAFAGMIFGQIRTLARLGWLANAAIWMNVFVIIASMAIIAHSGPNRTNGAGNGLNAFNPNFTPNDPVKTTAGAFPYGGFQLALIGLMQAVYSYGGAMLFVEFMAEMKRPFDFWKGMICAQSFIYICYMFYGLFCYSYQGQFVTNPAYQGIPNSQYAWQTACNSIALVSALIAAMLYGNIGIKVIYNNILMDFFRFPSLGTRAGKLTWVAIVPIYWAIAFVIAAAIPQVSNLGGLIAAACILQFSYTFPPWLMLGFLIKKDAMLPGDGFDPVTGVVIRQDSGIRRWIRGYMKKPIFNTWNLIFFLGSLATAGLGIYSSIKGIEAAYSAGFGTSFSCHNPYTGA